MTRTAYDLREKRIICRPFGIDKRKSDLKCISEIHHIVKTAEFDMGVEESYEYGKCNKDNLFACPSPNYTPDGKTVLTTIKEEDIERLFK